MMDFLGTAKKYLVTAKKCTSPFRCSLASAFGSNHPAWITSIPDRWRAIILRIFSYEVLIVFVFYFDCLKHSNFYPNILLYIIQTITGMIKYLWKNVKILINSKILNGLLVRIPCKYICFGTKHYNLPVLVSESVKIVVFLLTNKYMQEILTSNSI